MSIEAMKQAVEALERLGGLLTHKEVAVHAALRAAIEQAEKQEPVAWMYVNADMPTNRQLEWTETHLGYAGNWLKYRLYAAPRQWVGLTDIEIENLSRLQVAENGTIYQPSFTAIVRAIESLLTERNR